MCVYVYMLTDLKIAVWSARVVNWGGGAGRSETELSFFGYHGTDAVYLKGTVL